MGILPPGGGGFSTVLASQTNGGVPDHPGGFTVRISSLIRRYVLCFHKDNMLHPQTASRSNNSMQVKVFMEEISSSHRAEGHENGPESARRLHTS